MTPFRPSRWSHVRLAALFAGAVAAMTGCAIRDAERNIDRQTGRTDALAQKARTPPSSEETGNVRQRSDIWLGDRVIRGREDDPFPNAFNAVRISKVGSLRDIASEIERTVHIPVVVEGAEGESTGTGTGGAGGGAGTPQALPPPPLMGGNRGPATTLPPPPASAVNGGRAGGLRTVALRCNNITLARCLDSAGFQAGFDWEHKDGVILFTQWQTRTFSVATLPGDFESEAILTTNGGSSAAGGGSGGGTGVNASTTTAASSQTAKLRANVNVWNDVEAALKAMVRDGSFTVMPSTATVAVTAPRTVLNRVGAYIDGQNAKLSRQVAISVDVLSVSQEHSDDYGLDLKAAFARANDFNISWAGAPGVVTGAGAFTIGVLSPTSRWNGTQSVVQALRGKNLVSLLSNASTVTLNGMASPVQVVDRRAYVAQIETFDSSSGSSTGTVRRSIKPGVLTTGFTINVLPQVFGNGDIMLHYTLNLSELKTLVNFTLGSDVIQLPETRERGFMQRVFLHAGNTLLLAGFEALDDRSSGSGFPSEDLPLLGGKRSGSSGRTMIVILVTPTLLDGAAGTRGAEAHQIRPFGDPSEPADGGAPAPLPASVRREEP